jgi:glycine betaine/choline ABC-type transport system substrate-binding protein
MHIIVSLLIMIIIVLLFAGCTSSKNADQKRITVGSKHFTEQEILGEIMSILLAEKSDINVIRKLNLGGTMVCFNALRTGDIDLYAEYTGTGLVNILNKNPLPEPGKVYEIVKNNFDKQFGLIWLQPFGFNNTYTLTMRKSHAKSLNIKTISDVIPYKDRLLPGFDAEFVERTDGYQGLTELYGFEFGKKIRQMDPGLMYKAVAEGAVDIIDAFATDGRIRAYDLVILRDDRHYFPPYYAAPLIRKETLSAYPEIKEILNSLAGMINDKTMQELNYKVDEQEMNPGDVAREFLISKGLLE